MHPNIKIEAITTVSGNVGIQHTTANVLKILDVLNAESIPVYSGAQSALVEPSENASNFHGEDGLGDVGLPESGRLVAEEHAANALVRIAKENPGEFELIAIGPLTNLSLALRLDPDLPSRYKRLVIMGGAYHAKGNTSNPPAEFNISADPDAASIVFESWPKFTMVTWEATIDHGIPFDTFQSLLKYDNPRSRFLKNITEKALNKLKIYNNQSMSYSADPLAMAVLIEPEIVTESIERYVQIERFGSLSRGMTVVDWWGQYQKSPNAEIILRVEPHRIFELLEMGGK